MLRARAVETLAMGAGPLTCLACHPYSTLKVFVHFLRATNRLPNVQGKRAIYIRYVPVSLPSLLPHTRSSRATGPPSPPE